MVETVTRRDLPYAFEGTYDAKGVHSMTRNEFHEAGPDATRWVTHNEFEFHGVMKVVGITGIIVMIIILMKATMRPL